MCADSGKGPNIKDTVSRNSVLLEMLSSLYNCADQKIAENIKHTFQE
jgi:hypothetical protein